MNFAAQYPPKARPSVSADAPPRLGFESITRRFGPLAAVNGVDLDLRAGEILCLLGPSGCGKTTLLRIAAGLERMDSGRLLIDGKVVAEPGLMVPPEERGIGLMFQDYALFPHLTLLQNVGFGLVGEPDRDERAVAALDRVGLSDRAKVYPHTLSGGEQQRAALARALAPRPRVLLMDEPFSGLDRRLRDSVRADTATILAETGISSILVTHDPEEALLMADRVALMRHGKLVQAGSPEALYFEPVDAGAARFLSAVNEAAGTVAGGMVATPFGAIAAPGLADGERVRVLVRECGLRPTDRPEAPQARVGAVRFGGEMTHVTAHLVGDGAPVQLRLPGRPRIDVLDVIGLDADPAMTHVFRDGADETASSAR